MASFGKLLILAGSFMVLLGLVMVFSDKIPFLGRLPGDLHWKKDNLEIHIPITTSVLFSVAISVIVWLFSYISKK